jgi:hypothetical protein
MPMRHLGSGQIGARHRGLALAISLAALLLVPVTLNSASVRAASPAAASCTGWTDNTTPPPTIKVLRHLTGTVQTVDFKAYVKVVMAAEWPQSWPIESLRAGAVTIKEYAWYYAMHYRGGTGTGGCYDVSDSSADQIYSPETRALAAVDVQAVESTWSEYLTRSGLVFLTGYRSGNDGPCGADRDGGHLFQHTARTCAFNGSVGEAILHVYFDPVVLQGGPTAPGAPTAVLAQAYDQSAQVTWSAPGSNGGSVITSYVVSSTPDGRTCTTTGALTCLVTGLVDDTEYTFKVTATNWAGTGPASDLSVGVTPARMPGDTYHPMVLPVRLLDTRSGNGLSGKLVANKPRTFQVARRDVIPDGATAVTGNVTVVGETGGWAVYLGPTEIAKPASSTINFAKGDVIANGVTVALSPTGTLSATYLAGSGNTTDLVFDVTGYFTSDTSGATYHALPPARILDTRKNLGISGKLSANKPRDFPVWLHGNVPIEAIAVTGNVTAVNSTSAWAVYVGPHQIAKPATSTVNFKKGQVVANNLTVGLSSTGTLSATFMATSGTTDLVFDVTGYYTADLSGDKYVPIEPTRMLDTRIGNGLSGKIVANTPRTFPVGGRGRVPTDIAAVSGNVTVVNETSSWAVFIGPDPVALPLSSSLNFSKGDVKANGLTVAVSGSGTLSVTYMAGAGNTTDLVLDVTGYFQAPVPIK